ncbi:MAG: hypothetical protein V4724_18035 [Pseudomonadota bacterium]
MTRYWPCAALALACTGHAQAQDDDAWRTGASLEAWAYGSHNEVRRDSLLNPGNRVAAIASNQALLDARLNLRAEHDAFDVLLAPRAVAQTGKQDADAELSQGFIRYKSSGGVWPSVVLGRELYTWGPANFRSPSNPFYFDAGRTRPLALVPGIDLARGTWNVNGLRVSAAHVFSTSLAQPGTGQRDTDLIKIDRQGGNYLASLVVSKQRGAAPFAGGFAQYTLDDAWLLYGEFGSGRQATALVPGISNQPSYLPPYRLTQPAPRSTTFLLGAAYTLENGQVLQGEYLHDSGGYSADQAARYFAQARAAGRSAQTNPAAAYATLGLALGRAPRLLGRDYLWLNWQSNGQDSRQFWRLAWTQAVHDRSGQAQLYFERNYAPKLSGFVSLTANRGSVATEFGALLGGSIALGLKWFVF